MNTPTHTDETDEAEADETVEKQREKQSIKRRGIGTVVEAGREKEYIFSSTDMVHRRPALESDEGHALDPICGATLSEDNVWGGIDADTPEEVAREYGMVRFCSQCFRRSRELSKMGRAEKHNR